MEWNFHYIKQLPHRNININNCNIQGCLFIIDFAVTFSVLSVDFLVSVVWGKAGKEDSRYLHEYIFKNLQT